jgi:hypothetical protein
MAKQTTTTTATVDHPANGLDRRTLIAGGAAAGAVIALGTGEAFGSTAEHPDAELLRLIEEHKAAYAAFIVQCDRREELENRLENPEVIVPNLLEGGGFSSRLGEESVREHVWCAHTNQKRRLDWLAKAAPDLAEELKARLLAKARENEALVDQHFAELNEAIRDWDAANEADSAAVAAICAYPCRSLDGARIKAEHLLNETPQFKDGEATGAQVDALLRSFIGRAV